MNPGPGQRTPHITQSAPEMVNQSGYKVVYATVTANGRYGGKWYVVLSSTTLQPLLARLHADKRRDLEITLKFGEYAVVFVARVVKKGRKYFIYPLYEGQRFLAQIYEQYRARFGKRQPPTVVILDIKPR